MSQRFLEDMPPRYFFVQKLNFAVLGINPLATDSKAAIERPLLCYGLFSITFFNFLLVGHYIYDHANDYREVTDALPFFCQSVLTMVKIGIFIMKRHAIMEFIKFINQLNAAAKGAELSIVRRENLKEIFISTIYLRTVIITAIGNTFHPVIYAAYRYFSSGELILMDPNKATFFWPHSTIPGYTVVFLMNGAVIHFLCSVSLAIDTLFSWFVRNILAQYHILFHRFHGMNTTNTNNSSETYFKAFVDCIHLHWQTLDLIVKLNKVYGEIIFIKFVIVCTEICCLAFSILNTSDTLLATGNKVSYLAAVSIQLSLYCYCGQRIKDESTLVGTEIYNAFDWSLLDKSYKKMLLIPMLRSTKCSNLRAVFFEVDLALYLWVFKTASSFMTAIKTLEENKE